MRNPYEVLGVDRRATDAEIKKAYRRLARKHHPDVNPGDPAAQKKFQEIAAAYEVLKDAKRRQHFDLTGETGPMPPPGAPRGAGGPFPGGGPGGGFRWQGDFGDLFSELFSRAGAGGGVGGPFGEEEEDEDAAAELTVPFRDAVLGGTVAFRARLPRRCRRCGGTGRVGGAPCPTCRGSRTVVENEKVTVRIPPGVATGSKIRVPGKGLSEQGDLYLSLTVEPHPYFGREADDILAEVPVTVAEAYLGAEIGVPTIRGVVRAKIPPGTASGQKFRLKGYGVENRRTGTTGDHYYRVRVAIPRRHTPDGRAAAETLDRLYDRDPRSDLPKGL
ncbi:MAG: DnaJ C-terminal domain-containing protein [Acidithiobacillales bacterium]